MPFALIQDNAVAIYPYSIGQLMADNPGTSFPEILPDERLVEWGVHRLAEVPPPALDHTKVVTEVPPQFDGMRWVQTWAVRDATAEEAQAKADERADAIRAERDARLTQCDWTQLDDTPLSNTQKQAWAAYRQALRNVPQQAGFPWAVIWPEQP